MPAQESSAAQALAAHTLLADLTRHVPGLIYQLERLPDGRFRFPYASRGMEAIYELSAAQAMADASLVFQRLHPEDLDRVLRSTLESADTLQPWICEYRVLLPRQGTCWRSAVAHPQRQPDGGTLWHGFISDITGPKLAPKQQRAFNRDVLPRASMDRYAIDERGEVESIFGIGRDVSESLQMQERIQLAAKVFIHAREGIVITDTAGAIVDVNEAFCRITGHSREDVLGANPRILNSGRQDAAFYEAMWHSICKTGYWSGEIWNKRKNGEVYAEILTISAVRDAGQQVKNYVALFTDITPIKEHQQQLERMAHFDMLTGLPNRLLFAQRLGEAMRVCARRKRSLSVVYLDLDGFKAVNDTYGHDIGDRLLVKLAQRMRLAMREGDTLARFGGDEFVAVLVDLEEPQDCVQILERLLQAAADPVEVHGPAETVSLRVSASMGATIYPKDGADADLLLRHADQAMYLAKQAGKNRYHLFDVAHDAAVQVQRESMDQIRQALAKQEFVLYYQPKVNMQRRVVVGAEALIRWQHPQRGLLLPADFLPGIENHDLSVQVGEWVLDSALSQLGQWNHLGLRLPVSINVGALQLQQHGFVDKLRSTLARHPQVAHEQLELEILESSAMEDISVVAKVLHACRAQRVRLALDDFGTGYSSLTYLKHLPAETLKIDQSFVRDMVSDPEDMAIVQGVISLAKAFGRLVIAEGVETKEQSALLQSMGCHSMQGYGIARPMLAREFPGWVHQWQSKPGMIRS